MRLFGTILGWLISVGCLAYAASIGALMLGLSPQTRPTDGLSFAIGLVILPFYLAVGLAFNPMIFTRLPFARGFWTRLLVALVIVGIGLGVGGLMFNTIPNPIG